IRRTAFRRNGSLGARSIRGRLHPAGIADGEIRRRLRPRKDLRSYCEGRSGRRTGRAGIVQCINSRTAEPVPRRGIDEETARAAGYGARRRLGGAQYAWNTGGEAAERLPPPDVLWVWRKVN